MPKDRHFVGLPGCEGSWQKLGKLQFNYLVNEGLEPDHNLLDVGCGTFRGGRLFINYLEKGRYYGIDRNPNLLLYGIRTVLTKSGLILKRPTLYAVELGPESVDLKGIFGKVKFDYMWAHAVFDHIRPDFVRQAILDLSKGLSDDGTLCSTAFIVGTDNYHNTASWGTGDAKVRTYPDREYWHYTKDFFVEVAQDCELELTECSRYKHPLGLSMLKFVKANVLGGTA